MLTPRRRHREFRPDASAPPSSASVHRRNRGGVGRLGICAAALAGIAIAALMLPRWVGGEPMRANAAGNGAQKLRISDLTVPGPAAGLVAAEIGTPNRVGSETVPVRVYEPAGTPWGSLVWAHGGSFVRGELDWPEADWVSQRFAEAGLRVYSVDYVLASETVKAPAPAADVAAVLRWAGDREADALGERGPLFVGGASAGAHLATAAALAQADLAATGTARVADALILEYPTLHRVQQSSTEIAAITARLPEQRRFAPDRIASMYDFYLGAETGGTETEASVVGELRSDRLALLPPTVIVNAEADDLRASGEEFSEQLRVAGVPVIETVQRGTVHGYLNRPDESAEALRSAQETIEFFVARLRGIVAESGV